MYEAGALASARRFVHENPGQCDLPVRDKYAFEIKLFPVFCDTIKQAVEEHAANITKADGRPWSQQNLLLRTVCVPGKLDTCRLAPGSAPSDCALLANSAAIGLGCLLSAFLYPADALRGAPDCVSRGRALMSYGCVDRGTIALAAALGRARYSPSRSCG